VVCGPPTTPQNFGSVPVDRFSRIGGLSCRVYVPPFRGAIDSNSVTVDLALPGMVWENGGACCFPGGGGSV